MIVRPWLNEHEVRLIEALRSGKYQQTRGALRLYDSYCCLGVACDLYDQFAWRSNDGSEPGSYAYSLPDNDALLPFEVMQNLAWDEPDGGLEVGDRKEHWVSLANLNDSGFTFQQIADVIEAGLVVWPNGRS